MWKISERDDFVTVVQQATQSLVVCSPFITKVGIDIIEDNLPSSLTNIEVWTKFDTRDWITGASEPEALLSFLTELPESCERQIRVSEHLHAKFLLADNKVGLAGSANLTRGGMGGNIEIIRVIQSPEVDELSNFISNHRPLLAPRSLEDFAEFVRICENQAKDREALLDLIREVSPSVPASLGTLIPLQKFIRFCEENDRVVGQEIQRIYYNEDGNNRTGHLKQSYYAVQLFLRENPSIRAYVEANSSWEIPFAPRDHSGVIEAWLSFFTSRLSERNDDFGYDFATLFGYVTPGYGGRRMGGGGGDYPFRLVWGPVARLLYQ